MVPTSGHQYKMYRFADTTKLCLLLLIVCRPRKTNFRFLFAQNKTKFAIFVFHLQQTHGSCHFPLVPFSEYIYIWMAAYISLYLSIYIYICIALSIYIYICISIYLSISTGTYLYFTAVSKWKWKLRRFFLNPFTICSSWKWKFAICLFLYEETNGSYLIAKGM
jgi:hypothetical protein